MKKDIFVFDCELYVRASMMQAEDLETMKLYSTVM
jgi:hypothetical protein